MAETPHKSVAVREIVPPLRLTILRLRRPSRDDLARIGALIGTALPTQPNRAADGPVRVIWMGPDEWLIVGDTTPTRAIEEAATDAAAALCVSVGDGRCIFEVSGPAAPELIAKGTSLDLHRTLPASDRSAMTLFAQANAVIDRPPNLDGYRLIFDISVRHYLQSWFADAAIEFG